MGEYLGDFGLSGWVGDVKLEEIKFGESIIMLSRFKSRRPHPAQRRLQKE